MYLLDTYRAAGRELGHIVRADTPTHGALRDRLVVIVLTTVVVDLICAALGLLLERHVPQTDIMSYGSALFWTTTQLLTVSSQIHNPASVGGRLLDVFMEAYAMIVVTSTAGSLGAFFIRRAHDSDVAAGKGPSGQPDPQPQT